MLKNKNIFFDKKILIYGFGKSGLSTYKFLKKTNQIYIYDDKNISSLNKEVKKKNYKLQRCDKK